MNGEVFERETRYHISALDVAILADSGLATVPVPAAVWLFGSGLLGLIVIGRRTLHYSFPSEATRRNTPA